MGTCGDCACAEWEAAGGGSLSSLCLGVIVWHPQPHLAPASSCLGLPGTELRVLKLTLYLKLGLCISKARQMTDDMEPIL